MTSAFQGRIVAYENALNDTVELANALDRNVFRHVSSKPEQLNALVAYIHEQTTHLDAQPLEQILAGNLTFIFNADYDEFVNQVQLR